MPPLLYLSVLIPVSLFAAPSGGSAAAEGIAWSGDFETATSQSRSARKLLLAHFWMGGRPLAREMEIDTFSHPGVVRMSRDSFVCVRVDIQARSDLFERTIGGRGGLGTCILDGEGDVVSVLPGYANAEAFMEFLLRALRGYSRLRSARAAAAANAESPAHLQRLAEVYEELNSPRPVQACLEGILSLRPESPADRSALRGHAAFAHERLARTLALRGKNRDAASHVLQYRKLDPDNRFGRADRILLTEGLVAWIERRFRDSLRILQDALRSYPRSTERDKLLLALGTVQHESGDDRSALETLETVLREYPSSTSLRQARDQIYHIKNPPAEHVH